ncbi:MAG TPA: alpha/beta hydrolase [Thermoleophilaceae bacterium]
MRSRTPPTRARAAIAVAAIAVAFGAPPARAQTAAGYCEGDGGPAGAVTDAEHSVLVGDPPLPRGVRSSRITIEGVETRVQEAGPADAREAVVFMHGHPGSSRDWDALVAANGKFARTIAFDMTGYGQSQKAANQFQSTEGAARFVGAALDRLGVDRAVLAVHDFGAVWGLEWARSNPDRLLGAVLVNSGVYIDWIPHPQVFVWATPGAGEAEMAGTTRASFTEAIQARTPRRLPAAFVDRMYDDYDRATRCAALRYYRSGFENPDRGREQAEVLRRRSRPALVVWGEDDPYVGVEHAERQRQAFPGARIELIPDSGHWPFVDSAERVRELVVPFLRPTLEVERPRLRAGARRVDVRVSSASLLPALRVRARLRSVDRRGRASGVVGISRRPVTVRGRRVLRLELSRRLHPGTYELVVRARGLATDRSRPATSP